jgi:hypothetical protein
MTARWPAIGVLLLAGLPAGCQSTQDKSSKLAAQGKGLLTEHGVAVARRTKDVKVLSTAVIRDQNGTAAVVKLRNVSSHTLWNLPIAIDVRGAHGRSVFRNDAPGLEPTLAHVPLLRPGETVSWVNDQIEAADTAHSVKATVGAGGTIAASRLPRIVLSSRGLRDDPVSGFAVVGSADNRSKVDLRKVVVFAVARRHGRVVAAGKGQIARLKAGKKVPFQAFLIGDPRGAGIELSAPPPNFR